MGLLIGGHLSIGGGFDSTFAEADEIGANAIQIFLKSNRSWTGPALTLDKIKEFKQAQKKSNVEVVMAHAGYLINLASPKPDILQKSIYALIDELNRCEQLGVPFLILHPGSCGDQSRETGIARISSMINRVFEETPNFKTKLLLETMAGQGSMLGSSFEELAQIRVGVEQKNRVGYCLDSAHLFVSGYDFRNNAALNKLLQKFDDICGLKNLHTIHLNDSKKEFDSRVDRHENIGEGKIGLQPLRNLIHHPKLTKVAIALETPWHDGEHRYEAEMRMLK